MYHNKDKEECEAEMAHGSQSQKYLLFSPLHKGVPALYSKTSLLKHSQEVTTINL